MFTRVNKIPFRHYHSIASLEPAEQEIWVKKILENGKDGNIMSREDLKLAVREHKRLLALKNARNHNNPDSPIIRNQDALEFLD